MSRPDINCGDQVKCKITGFKGTVTLITEHINGCTQCAITPKCGDDAKFPESVEIDIESIVKLKAMPRIERLKEIDV